MTNEEIKAKAEAFGKWYHGLELFPGFITDHQPFEDIWDQIRAARAGIDYQGKSVLDLGTMDGMWALDAEKAGARLVVAGDIWANPRLDLVKRVFNSQMITVPNADVHCLHERLKVLMQLRGISGFDVVQCMGVIYHLQNPMLALNQIRHCISDDGLMLLETGCWTGGGDEPVARLNRGQMIYADGSTYWMMNFPCLEIVLGLCGFKVEPGSVKRFWQHGASERVCCICRPTATYPSPDNYGV